jgi:4'-phosphopantetheinyl transferase
VRFALSRYTANPYVSTSIVAWVLQGAEIVEEAIEILVTRLDAPAETVDGLSGLLSDAERRRASRLVFSRDRRRFIVARAWLRQLLGARLGTAPEDIELAYGSHGKPALGPRFASSDLRFNLSHREDLAACALVEGREIGVDIEAVRVMEDADQMAEQFFSTAEQTAFRTLEPAERPLGFFNCWTRKEAFVKAMGDGLSHPLDTFDVSLIPGEPAQLLRVGNESGDRWRMMSFSPASGFVGAVVAERKSR